MSFPGHTHVCPEQSAHPTITAHIKCRDGDNLFSPLFTSNVYVHTYLMLGDGDSLESTGKQGRSKGEGTESSSRTRHIDLKDRECAASSSTSSGVF